VQLKSKIISPIPKPQCRQGICYVQTRDMLAINLPTVRNKIKTVHNPESKCREKTMTYCKNAHKIKVTSLKHDSAPKNQKIEITQIGL
jgi:hypothetical protein